MIRSESKKKSRMWKNEVSGFVSQGEKGPPSQNFFLKNSFSIADFKEGRQNGWKGGFIQSNSRQELKSEDRKLNRRRSIRARVFKSKSKKKILDSSELDESSEPSTMLEHNQFFRMSQKTLSGVSSKNFKVVPKMPPSSWVPGYRSKLNKYLSKRNDIVRASKLSGDKFRKTKFQYKEKDVEDARSKPIIRCSSKYMSKFDIEMEKEKKRKRKILVKRKVLDKKTGKVKEEPVDFNTNFRNEKLKRNNFLNMKVKYRPVSAHKFRKLDKKRWVGGSFTVY